MKIGSFLAVAVAGIVLTMGSASAGGGRGCYRGGGWGGGGPGWCGPRSNVSFGFFVGQPVQPVYRQVYVQQPVYVQRRVSYGYQGGGSYENSLLASAQARLARLGYYRGYIDGDFGPQTARAVRNYQIDNGLPVTGRLDGRTLASLGV